ncbi:MAG: tetratricopeptide repeat protein, partial [Roseiflexaceae bacterium]
HNPNNKHYQKQQRHAEAHVAIVAGYDEAITAGDMTYSAPLEWDNVTAAIERLARRADDDRSAQALLGYAQGWRNVIFNNYDSRRVAWLSAARIAADRIGSAWQQANVRQAIGDVQQFRKETNAALESYQQALTLYQAVGDRLGEANVRQAIGDVQQFRDQRDAALESYQQALTLFQAVGSKLGEANTLAAQSRLLIDADSVQSQVLLEQAATQRQAIDDVYGMAVDQYNYGLALLDRGRNVEALPFLLRARQLFASRGLDIDVRDTDALIARARGEESEAGEDDAGGDESAGE